MGISHWWTRHMNRKEVQRRNTGNGPKWGKKTVSGVAKKQEES